MKTALKTVYIAHPLGAGPDREKNRINAMRWVGKLAKLFPIAPVADWIILSGEWEETEENRASGLAIDCALITRCDELWLVGGRISEGMGIERMFARSNHIRVRDFTHLGYNPEEAEVAGLVDVAEAA